MDIATLQLPSDEFRVRNEHREFLQGKIPVDPVQDGPSVLRGGFKIEPRERAAMIVDLLQAMELIERERCAGVREPMEQGALMPRFLFGCDDRRENPECAAKFQECFPNEESVERS